MHASSRILAGVLLLASPAAFAQSSSATVSVPASARIYKPITLVLNNGGLSFGDVFADASGDVTLNPQSNARTTTGPALAATGTANPAIFTVGGKRNASYAITLPANGTVTLTGPGTAMAVSNFTASVAGTAPASSATGLIPDSAGATQTFKVGATLTLGASQADGDYSGTFNVTVAYN